MSARMSEAEAMAKAKEKQARVDAIGTESREARERLKVIPRVRAEAKARGDTKAVQALRAEQRELEDQLVENEDAERIASLAAEAAWGEHAQAALPAVLEQAFKAHERFQAAVAEARAAATDIRPLRQRYSSLLRRAGLGHGVPNIGTVPYDPENAFPTPSTVEAKVYQALTAHGPEPNPDLALQPVVLAPIPGLARAD